MQDLFTELLWKNELIDEKAAQLCNVRTLSFSSGAAQRPPPTFSLFYSPK